MKPNNQNHGDQNYQLGSREMASGSYTSQLVLLSIWVFIGLILRLVNLDLKPASSIEISTIGFSLGHGFKDIALDQIITLESLLSPLQYDHALNYSAVWERLRQESTHPPLYFWLTHWWIQLWTPNGALVSLSVARSLSVIFGVLAIPAIFSLARLAFRSWQVAHLTAVLMAVSPYGIYLAQEARHYTLTILWVIASLSCLVRVLQLITQKALLPRLLLGCWIIINGLGFATHYFFALAVAAEVLGIFAYWVAYRQYFNLRYYRDLILVALGTTASYLVWLPVVAGISNNELTDWIKTSWEFSELLQPILRLLAWLITMVMLLPIEGVPKAIAIICGLILLGVLGWILPVLIKSWRSQLRDFRTRLATVVFGSYLLGSLVIVLLVIYGVGKDISLAARYHFIYFPVLLLLVASALVVTCRRKNITDYPLSTSKILSTRIVAIFLVLGLLGSITVVNNFGFQKSRQSDRLAAYIQDHQQDNIFSLVAMTHMTHAQLRELIGLAYSFSSLAHQDNIPFSSLPHFLLLNSPQDNDSLTKIFATIPQSSFDLFAVNLEIPDPQLNKLGCFRDAAVNLPNSGYDDRFYRCNL